MSELNKLIPAILSIAASLEVIAAAQAAGGSAAPAAETKPAGKATAGKATGAGKGAAAKPKHSFEEMKALLVKVKDTLGKEEAQAVFSPMGYAKMTDIQEKDYDAIVAVATKVLEDAEAGGGSDDDDI